MGCDMHGVVEYLEDSRWWSLSGEIQFPRSYAFFARLAGVRNYNEVEPLAAERGLPRDPSGTTFDSIREWQLDAHSVSWATPEEFRKAFDGRTAWEFGSVAAMMDDAAEHASEVRLVFWFDN